MQLKKVTIHKYKSFESEQKFDLENDITILVGINESGKTSALEAIAKTRYFQDDESFKFNATHDYPRKEKKQMEKSGENPEAITCTYEIDNNLLQSIEKEMGKGILKSTTFSVTTKYDNKKTINISVDSKKFIEHKTKELGISSDTLNDKLLKVKNKTDLETLQKEYTEENKVAGIKSFAKYFENTKGWENDPIGKYVYQVLLEPKMGNLIVDKIIHKNKIHFFDEFLESHDKADLEDLFAKQDYLNLFNSAFSEYADIQLSDLNQNIKQIIIQINKHINKDRFNHYRPANELVKKGIKKEDLSAETLDNFEKVFKKINQLFV